MKISTMILTHFRIRIQLKFLATYLKPSLHEMSLLYYYYYTLQIKGRLLITVSWTLKYMRSSDMHGLLTLTARFLRAKTPKVRGVTNVLSLDLLSKDG